MTSDPTPDRHREAREGLREAAAAVVAQAEADDNFEGEYVDYLVPADALDALRAALASPAGPDVGCYGQSIVPDTGAEPHIWEYSDEQDDDSLCKHCGKPETDVVHDTGAEERRFDRTWSHYADDCPSPPSGGAEERLRAALDAALDREPTLDEVREYGMDGGLGSAFNTLQWRLDLIRSALSGGSVDEERDSDES